MVAQAVDPRVYVLAVRRAVRTLKTRDQIIAAESDWRAWLTTVFPGHVDRGFAPYHEEFWHWVWNVREGERARPFVGIWPRSAGKSTSAELACAALAARRARTYTLLISETQDQADDHVQNVAGLLESTAFGVAYPDVASRKVGKYGNVRGWRRNRLRTASGFTIDAIGLDTAARGAKIEEDRPDLLIADDLDGKLDTAATTAKKITTLTHTILPAGSDAPAVLAVQNKVTADGIFARLADGRADFLADRIVSGPHPALRNLAYEQRDGRAVLVAGEPTWEAMDLRACQAKVDEIGLTAFLAECHPAGTRIAVVGHSPVPIEQIKPGDAVVTHTGQTGDVSRIFARRYSGLLYSIRRAYRDLPLRATERHPLYVARRPVQGEWWPGGGSRCLAGLIYEWAPPETVRKGDFLTEPVPSPPRESSAIDGAVVFSFTQQATGRPARGHYELRATPALLRLLGYYLAEGNLSSSASVKFTFHASETGLCREVHELVAETIGAVPVSQRTSRNTEHAIEVSVSSTVAASFFSQAAGTGARNKRLPGWVYQCSPELMAELLIGYWRGDGWRAERGFHFATASEGLAEDIRRLLLHVGVVAAVGYRTRKTTYGGDVDRDLWELRIRGGFAKRFAECIGESFETCGRNQAFIANGYVHYPVTDVTASRVDDLPVFNFEVEGDQSYLADGVCSHNCQHEVEAPAGGMFDHLEFRHCRHDEVPDLIRIVVWVDPAVTSTDKSDAHGIQADGLASNGDIYRLFSWEDRTSPRDALRRAIRKAVELKAEAVGVETDQGGDTWQDSYELAAQDLVEDGEITAEQVPAFREEKAGAGYGPKVHRASQMLVDYERGRFVHVLGTHEVLEKALRRFPLTKPFDLVDGGVWSWMDLTDQLEDEPVPAVLAQAGAQVRWAR